MTPEKFYFRCKQNPSAPLLVLDSFWEAQEMKGHPDYERVDAFGEVVIDEADTAATQIPFHAAGAKRKAA